MTPPSRTRTVWIIVVLAAVLGIGSWIAAPNVVGAILPFLLLAVCPLAMMFMMGGMGHGHDYYHGMQQRTPGGPLASRDPDGSYGASDERGALTSGEHMAALKVRLARLEAEQAALAHQLAELEADRTNEVVLR